MINKLSISSTQSRSAFIRNLLTKLKDIPQISHPSEFSGVRSRYIHTRNMCRAANYLNNNFSTPQPLWQKVIVHVACHDIGHTPYGHAGERVVRDFYLSNFSNRDQSKRFMFIDNNDWPNHIKPLKFYDSKPIIKPQPEEEVIINNIVKLFDNFENAVGDAIDLRIMGKDKAFRFLNNNCSWSRFYKFENHYDIPFGIFQIIKREFPCDSFESLSDKVSDKNHTALIHMQNLREIINCERLNCDHIKRMDSKAELEIKKAYKSISDNLKNIYSNSGHDEDFINLIAIDILSSTGNVEKLKS